MSVLLDEETVLLESLEFEPPCETQHERAAKFLMRCRGCGRGPLLCADCVKAWRAKADLWVLIGATIHCRHCLRISRSFAEAVEVVPL